MYIKQFVFYKKFDKSIPFLFLIPWFFSFLCRSGWHLPLRLPFLARTCPFSEWCHSWVAFCFSSQWEVSTASATWQLIWWGFPAHCTLLIFIEFHLKYLAKPWCLISLWGQQIKLIQVISTSEFHEYLKFFCPLHFAQGLRSKKSHNYFTF